MMHGNTKIKLDCVLQLVVQYTCEVASHRLATSRVYCTTSCNTQSSAPEDGQNNCPKHVELTGIINKPLSLHLVGCLCYLYQWRTVKQISDNEIYLLTKYIKSVPWRVAKRLSYIEDARCLKVNGTDKYNTVTLTAFCFVSNRLCSRFLRKSPINNTFLFFPLLLLCNQSITRLQVQLM